MSTHACVLRQNQDESVTGIYIHFDGYPDFVGATLRDYYPKQEQVDALIALGSLSSLNRTIACPEGHSFRAPAPDCSVAYHRDRGDDWSDVMPKRFPCLDVAIRYCGDIDYIYLWTEALGWRCVGRYGKRQDISIP